MNFEKDNCKVCEIESEEEGVIEEICVANEAAVEYGQTLFLIKKG